MLCDAGDAWTKWLYTDNTDLGEVKVTEVVKYSIDFSKKDILVFTAVDKKIKAPLNAGKTFSIFKEKEKLFFVKFLKKMEIEWKKYFLLLN